MRDVAHATRPRTPPREADVRPAGGQAAREAWPHGGDRGRMPGLWLMGALVALATLVGAPTVALGLSGSTEVTVRGAAEPEVVEVLAQTGTDGRPWLLVAAGVAMAIAAVGIMIIVGGGRGRERP